MDTQTNIYTAYLVGVLVGIIIAILLSASVWVTVRATMIKIDTWLVSKLIKNYVNQLHDKGREKRKVLLRRKNRKRP